MVIFKFRKRVDRLEKKIESLTKTIEAQREIVEKLNTIYGVELLKQSTHKKQTIEDMWMNGERKGDE